MTLAVLDRGLDPWPAIPLQQRAGNDLEAELEALSGLGLDELRVRWRKVFRKSPPPHLPRYLMLRILAYRMQAKVFGDLDRESVRYLEKIMRERTRRRAKEEKPSKGPPPVPPVPDRRGLMAGTLLVREFGGRLNKVTVVAEGFQWQGTTYGSLSEIARLITGTRWNGPRFFGLRDKPGKVADAGEGRG